MFYYVGWVIYRSLQAFKCFLLDPNFLNKLAIALFSKYPKGSSLLITNPIRSGPNLYQPFLRHLFIYVFILHPNINLQIGNNPSPCLLWEYYLPNSLSTSFSTSPEPSTHSLRCWLQASERWSWMYVSFKQECSQHLDTSINSQLDGAHVLSFPALYAESHSVCC